MQLNGPSTRALPGVHAQKAMGRRFLAPLLKTRGFGMTPDSNFLRKSSFAFHAGQFVCNRAGVERQAVEMGDAAQARD